MCLEFCTSNMPGGIGFGFWCWASRAVHGLVHGWVQGGYVGMMWWGWKN